MYYIILPLWKWYLCIPFLGPHFEMMHSKYEKERKKSSLLLMKVWNPIAIALPLIWYKVKFFWWKSLRLDQPDSVGKITQKVSFFNIASEASWVNYFIPNQKSNIYQIQIEYLSQLKWDIFRKCAHHLHHHRFANVRCIGFFKWFVYAATFATTLNATSNGSTHCCDCGEPTTLRWKSQLFVLPHRNELIWFNKRVEPMNWSDNHSLE